MIAPSTSLNSALLFTYNRSGQSLSLLRSEPVQRVVVAPTTETGEEQAATDSVSLSPEGLEKSRQGNGQSSAPAEAENEEAKKSSDSGQSNASLALTPEEQQVVQELKLRDSEVKAHEMAHLAAAGQYARGGASYTYQQGPDGRRYAIGGEVPIDLSAEKKPEETIDKMRTIKRAAMAPADPSSADRSVAASATAVENNARQELQTQDAEAARSPAETEAESAAASAVTPAESSVTAPTDRSIDVVA